MSPRAQQLMQRSVAGDDQNLSSVVKNADPTPVTNFKADQNSLHVLEKAITKAEDQTRVKEARVLQETQQEELAENVASTQQAVVQEEVVKGVPVDPGVLAQALPISVEESDGGLNPVYPATSTKEAAETTTPDAAVLEAGQAIQYVEQEPNPEIPPEVEHYLQRVEDNAQQAPEEIVLADGQLTMPTEHNLPAKPVVVLPITPEQEKQGAKENPKFSIRWLVEWSRKIMKIFVGKVIYREVASPEK